MADNSAADDAASRVNDSQGQDADAPSSTSDENDRALTKTTASAKGGRKRTWLRPTLFAVLPLVLVGAGCAYVLGGEAVETDDAYVEADSVEVSTDVSGVVIDVDVTENQHVVAGQVLYRLDGLPFRLALERAQAEAGMVRDDLLALKARYRDMQAQLMQARHDFAYYQHESQRQQYLSEQHVASDQTFEGARRNQDNARERVASLIQQLAGVAASLNGDPDAPIEQHPRYRDAMAQRDEAARQLDHTVVRAAFAGVVTNVPSIARGKYLAASTTAFYLVASDHVWVDSNPKETQLTYVRIGQPVEVTVDTYPNTKWQGTVESISPASAQQFSLLPAQNTSGNWVKVVQRIPLRVRIDITDGKEPPLRAGMSVEIEVHTGHRRGLPHFLGGRQRRV
jgi:membrane fusion protein (multidrug efflux system)